MKVLITGATGLVGKRLVKELTLLQHDVIILSRSKESAKKHFTTPCEIYEWNPTHELPPKEAIEKADVIVNLMGENLAAKRWSAEQKQKIYDSRINGTNNLVQAINEYKKDNLKCFISGSAVGIYKPNIPSKLSEKSPYGTGFLQNICIDWEEEAQKCEKADRTVILRTGVVLAREGGMMAKIFPLFKFALGGPIGLGKQMMSWIHVDDLVKIILDSITNENYNGAFNCVAPTSVNNKEFTKAFSKSLGVPNIFPAPTIMLKLAFGEMSQLMLDSVDIDPTRLREVNHSFLYPDINSALDNICGVDKDNNSKKKVMSN